LTAKAVYTVLHCAPPCSSVSAVSVSSSLHSALCDNGADILAAAKLLTSAASGLTNGSGYFVTLLFGYGDLLHRLLQSNRYFGSDYRISAHHCC